MANVTVLPMAEYAPQVFQVPPAGSITVADDITEIGARFWRETSSDTSVWNDPEATISYHFEISVDGAPFDVFFDGGPEPGGIRTNKLGAEILYTDFISSVPSGVNRLLRGTVTFVAPNGTLKTQCDVTVL